MITETELQTWRPIAFQAALRFLGGERREDAEDIAQEAMVRLWDRRDELDVRNPKALVRVIVHNLCCTLIANVVPDRMPDFYDDDSAALPDVLIEQRSPEALCLNKLETAGLRRAILSLSREHRDVILLHHVEEVSLEAMTALLGVGIGTLKSRLGRARNELAKLLGKSEYIIRTGEWNEG